LVCRPKKWNRRLLDVDLQALSRAITESRDHLLEKMNVVLDVMKQPALTLLHRPSSLNLLSESWKCPARQQDYRQAKGNQRRAHPRQRPQPRRLK
jgi:hypothetical protein